jgi:hypothetical protein
MERNRFQDECNDHLYNLNNIVWYIFVIKVKRKNRIKRALYFRTEEVINSREMIGEVVMG